MASFIIWISKRIDNIKSEFSTQFVELRKEAYRDCMHNKLPEQVAFLQFSLDTSISWMIEKGVMSEDEGSRLSEDGWSIFLELATKQSRRIEQDDPVLRFMEIVHTMLVQAKIKIEHRTLESQHEILGGTDGELIGYFDDTYLYFMPQGLWHSIQSYNMREGTHFPFSKRTLYSMLKSKGFIVSSGDENLSQEWIKGRNKKYLKVVRDKMLN